MNPTLLFDFLSRWIHEFCSSLLLQVPYPGNKRGDNDDDIREHASHTAKHTPHHIPKKRRGMRQWIWKDHGGKKCHGITTSQKLAYDRKGNIDGDGWHFRKQKTSAEENDGGDDRVDGHNPLCMKINPR